MYCVNCGAKLDEGERFCSSCGAKAEEQPIQPSIAPAPPAYPQAGQTPYPPAPPAYPQAGQTPYPPASPAYGQAGGQPPYPPAPPSYDRTGGQPPRRKPGKGLWIGIGAGALALILILVLFVYPGVLVGRRGPLSGNTVQTRFVNDSVAVFTDAFSGLADSAVSEMMFQPFEMSADVDVDTDYSSSSGTIDMAYDGLSFGLKSEGEGSTNTLLLLEDTLYLTTYGGVQGIEFDTTEADLSENMGLAERLKALLGSDKESNADVDWKKAAELLVNSINKDCFEKTSSENTLTMDSGDLTDMLNAFWEKLEADDELRESLEDYLKDMTGESVDMEELIDQAIALIKAADPTLEWVVSYDKGKPVSIEITIEVGGQEITASFGYEKSGSAVEITFEINTGGQKTEGSLSYERTKDGLELSGEIRAGGQKITIEGIAARTKEKISGSLEITVGGYTTTFDYDGTLNIGKPQDSVEDMFDIDTSGAYVQKISQLLFGYYLPDIGVDYDDYAPDESAVASQWPETSEAPAEASTTYSGVQSLDGTFWISEGYQSGGMYVEGIAMYFYGGMVYFGTESMTADECYAYSDSFSPYDVSYTYDGLTVTLTAEGISESQEFYMIDDNTMMGPDGSYYYRQ